MTTSISITREYWFSAAHRLEGHPKCGRLHGHNYRLLVTITSDDMDTQMGWIMDFGDLDKVVKPILDDVDHRYLVSEDNSVNGDPYFEAATGTDDCRLLPIMQTTAELLAQWFWDAIQYELDTAGRLASVCRIELWETHRSFAVVGLDHA